MSNPLLPHRGLGWVGLLTSDLRAVCGDEVRKRSQPGVAVIRFGVIGGGIDHPYADASCAADGGCVVPVIFAGAGISGGPAGKRNGGGVVGLPPGLAGVADPAASQNRCRSE
jgi:hypothetical protein